MDSDQDILPLTGEMKVYQRRSGTPRSRHVALAISYLVLTYTNCEQASFVCVSESYWKKNFKHGQHPPCRSVRVCVCKCLVCAGIVQ